MPGLTPSRRVGALKPSVTVAITNKAKALKREGKDVLGFAAGEPDFDTPAPIKDAAKAAMDAGETRYKPTLGDPETRDCIAAKLVRENRIDGLTGQHVGVQAGGKHSLFVAMHCLLDPPHAPGAADDPRDVLLPVPAWVSYRPIAEMAGGRVVEIATSPDADFKITPEQLAEAITPQSRLLVLNSPSNPCGTMYAPDELRALAAVVAEKANSIAPSLVVLTDEIYEKIVYGDHPHFSIGSVPEIAERTLTLNGMSKAFAMTGWRIGYAAMPGDFGKTLIKAMGTMQGQMTTNITSFNYAAIRCALTDAGVAEEVERMRLAFAARAKLIEGRIAEIPGITTPRPTGAFYVFPDISGLFGRQSPVGRVVGSALDLCESLLDEAGLALVPGEDFGGCGPDHVRISFACSEDQINAGMDRLADFVSRMQ
ncbi:MAG: pyridoxal phosphate-dependent aminotransferase [Planctomycetota bacterium]